MASRESLRKNLAVALALALVSVIVILGCLWVFNSGDRAARWGRGLLTVSERAYYEARINKIIGTWQRTWQMADSGSDGRLEPAYNVYLVVDTTRHTLWIEDRGQILEASYSELPRQLTWRLYHDDEKGLAPLPGVARFRRRGIMTSRLRPEKIWLVGRGRGQNGSLIFHFNCSSLNSNHVYSLAASRTKWPAPPAKESVNYYASIVVHDDEYEQSRRAWAGTRAEGSAARPEQLPEDPRQAAWSKVEAKLYQMIESQVSKTGFHLSELEVEPGPAWSAAHAHVMAERRSFLGVRRRNLRQYLFGTRQFADCYLKIDPLGDGLWYASTAPHGLPGGQVLKLEFVVSDGGSVTQEEQSHRLVQGREKQHPTAPPESPWRITLPNGATVAILGISRITGEERHWWGPDGSQETSVPEFFPESRFYSESPPKDEHLARRYEVVWLVDWPLPASGATSFSWSIQDHSGNSPLVPSVACDRYGERYQAFSDMDTTWTTGSLDGTMMRRFYAAGILCRSLDIQTTFALGLRVNQGYVDWVTFRNVSLRPGEDPGFEIVQGEGDGR